MILHFHNVSCATPPGCDSALEGAEFALESGQLLLLRVAGGERRSPVPDLAQGLLGPDGGRVEFHGEDWQQLAPDHAAARRGEIGRVFDTGGWLSNLDVDENITLAQRYHTERAESDILAEARRLAGEFGLDGLPAGRPHTVGRETLRRAQWVRAFLGEPALLIFEHATRELEPAWAAKLIGSIGAARTAGAAVLWITTDATEVSLAGLNPTLKFELKATRMIPLEGRG